MLEIHVFTFTIRIGFHNFQNLRGCFKGMYKPFRAYNKFNRDRRGKKYLISKFTFKHFLSFQLGILNQKIITRDQYLKRTKKDRQRWRKLLNLRGER